MRSDALSLEILGGVQEYDGENFQMTKLGDRQIWKFYSFLNIIP